MGNRRRMRDVASGIFAGFAGRKKFCPQPLQKIAVGAILQKLFEPP